MYPGESPEEILKRAAEVCRAVHSYRVVETDTQEHFGRRVQEMEERIQVGDDSYSRRFSTDDDGDPREELNFRGEIYWRGPGGEWEKPILVASGLGTTRWQGSDAQADAFRNWVDGGLFRILDLGNVAQLPDEKLGGRLLMRFRELSEIKMPPNEPEEWHREFRNSFPRPEAAPQMPDEAIRFLSSDQSKLVDDLWRGKDDLLLYRSEVQGETYNRGELTSRVHTTREYSDFNTAELPEPLPEF